MTIILQKEKKKESSYFDQTLVPSKATQKKKNILFIIK